VANNFTKGLQMENKTLKPHQPDSTTYKVDINYQANIGTNNIVASTVSVPYGFGGSGNGVTTTGIDFEADAMKGINFEDYKLPIMFEDIMPEMHKIKEMCELYPSLDIAFQKFKNVYNIVIDDYDNKMQLKMPF
jgi:hypothetical protein